MVDICLELPDELIRFYELRALALGQTAEDLIRKFIEDSGPSLQGGVELRTHDFTDEPIVKAAEIEHVCRRLAYPYGWRFITCPQANARSAKLLLVSLNPGGRQTHGPAWSQEEGSAYRVESWNGAPPGSAPLQRQVQQLFSLLGVRDDEVFSAHYVPFRSPNWGDLEHKQEAESFSWELWSWLRPQLTFDRIVCIGKELPGKPIARLFSAKYDRAMPVGWGAITADRYRLPDGRSLIALPHLSRFGVFGRPAGKAALKALFEIG